MKNRKKAVIVDIDGTIADITHRLHFIQDKYTVVDGVIKNQKKDWDSFYGNVLGDEVIIAMRNLLVALHGDGIELIYVSGRREDTFDDTISWFVLNDVPFDRNLIFLRMAGDKREDAVVKFEIYKDCIEHKFDVQFVLEDRVTVVAMWRSLGLLTLQCAEGNF